MHQDGVARLHSWRHFPRVVGLIRTQVVGGQQAGKGRLLPRAFEVEGIHVIDMAARGGLRFAPRADGNGSDLGATHAVGVGKHQPDLVLGVRGQIEDAAGEHIGREVTIEVLAIAVAGQAAGHGFVLQPEQRQRLVPARIAFPAIADLHRGIAIVVARDAPLEAQGAQRGRFSPEVAGHRLALRVSRLRGLGVGRAGACHRHDQRKHQARDTADRSGTGILGHMPVP
jgi:hypothetical protein